MKIGVLISGNGSNLQTLIDKIADGYIAGQIAVVVSNRSAAFGLERARLRGIPAFFVSRKAYISDHEFDCRILDILDEHHVDLVVLAGYLRILSPIFINRFRHRIINIHPALIPAFCGMGFYGEKVHQAVIDYGAKITGATVHFVDEGADTGPIIIQETLPVLPNDTAETLQKKVLVIEHRILPMAVKLFCENKLTVIERRGKRCLVDIKE